MKVDLVQTSALSAVVAMQDAVELFKSMCKHYVDVMCMKLHSFTVTPQMDGSVHLVSIVAVFV